MTNIYHRFMYVFFGDCGHCCQYEKPYGFVPEADCPVHDAPPLFFEVIHPFKP